MSIEDYLAGLPTQRRKRVGRLLELISNIAPQAEASMKYRCPLLCSGTAGSAWATRSIMSRSIPVPLKILLRFRTNTPTRKPVKVASISRTAMNSVKRTWDR